MSILSTALFEQYSLLLLQQIAGDPAGVEVQSNMSTAVYRQNTLTLLQYIATHGGGGGLGSNTKTVGIDSATIQGCIDLCTSASQSNTYTVLVPPKAGGYSENLTLKGSVSIVGLTGPLNPNSIQINGSHTYAPALASPNANRLGFQNLTFTSASVNANTITVLPTAENPYQYASQLKFSGCIFSGNKNNTFSQISTCDNVSLYIDNCRFESAGGDAASVGITQGNGPLYLSNNTIFNVFGRALDVPVSTTTARTVTSTTGSNILSITLGSITGLTVGQKISGTGIAAGTVIVDLTAPSTVVMSGPPSIASVEFSAKFGETPYVEIHDSVLQGAGPEVVRLGNGLLTCNTSNFTNTVNGGSGINMQTAGTVVGIINSSFAISDTAAFVITAAATSYAALNGVSYSSSALVAFSTRIAATVVVLDYAARATSVPDGGTGAATLTGLVKGNGTNPFTAAIPGTDYVATATIPATATSAGVAGRIAIDNANSLLYVCTATNVWKRVPLTTF